MASYGPSTCPYCGAAPCTGNACPSNRPDYFDDDDGCCIDCGRTLRPGDDYLRCRECDEDDDHSVLWYGPGEDNES